MNVAYKVFYKCTVDDSHRILWCNPIGEGLCEVFCEKCLQPMKIEPPTTEMIDKLVEQSLVNNAYVLGLEAKG